MLEGKVAVVSGARGGIGAAIVARLAAAGAQVVASDLYASDDPLAPGASAYIAADISLEEDVVAIVETARSTFGRLDVLVNVAAITGSGLAEDRNVVDMALDSWDRIMNVNLRGTMLMCRHAIPLILEGGGGAIVNVSSRAAVMGNTHLCAYSASKAGVNSLTLTIARSFGKQGIRANAVMPGIILGTGSANHGQLTPDYLAAVQRRLSVDRLGRPDDIARLVAFLASDEDSGYMNGQILSCDGGQS